MNWRAILLITGTCIGAAALPLPIFLAPYGLWGALSILLLAWLVMWAVSMLVLEALSAFPEDVSYVSMAEHTLGVVGKYITWIAYVCLLYALIAAYLSGVGSLLSSYSGWPAWVSSCLVALVGVLSLGMGVCVVDKLNKVFSFALIFSFCVIFGFGISHFSHFHVVHATSHMTVHALPIVMLAFGYQVVIPSVYQLEQRSPWSVVRTVTIGSLIPLVLYVLWIGEVFALIPMHGPWGLSALHQAADPAKSLVVFLSHILSSAWVVEMVACFIVSAMVTSFFGISLSLFDLWVDALQVDRTKRWLLGLVSILPALAFSLVYPEGFMLALKYAAIFVAILSGLLPIAMVVVMRFRSVPRLYQAPVTASLFVALLVFFMLAILTCL